MEESNRYDPTVARDRAKPSVKGRLATLASFGCMISCACIGACLGHPDATSPESSSTERPVSTSDPDSIREFLKSAWSDDEQSSRGGASLAQMMQREKTRATHEARIPGDRSHRQPVGDSLDSPLDPLFAPRPWSTLSGCPTHRIAANPETPKEKPTDRDAIDLKNASPARSVRSVDLVPFRNPVAVRPSVEIAEQPETEEPKHKALPETAEQSGPDAPVASTTEDQRVVNEGTEEIAFETERIENRVATRETKQKLTTQDREFSEELPKTRAVEDIVRHDGIAQQMTTKNDLPEKNASATEPEGTTAAKTTPSENKVVPETRPDLIGSDTTTEADAPVANGETLEDRESKEEDRESKESVAENTLVELTEIENAEVRDLSVAERVSPHATVPLRPVTPPNQPSDSPKARFDERTTTIFDPPKSSVERKFENTTRRAAKALGFGMLALDCLEPPTRIVDAIEPAPRAAITIHENRLRELARGSLQKAVYQLSRRATHSARRSTMEALNHLIAMLDGRESGNEHARQLSIAMDAIRESGEFAVGTYVVDQAAIARMIAVHKTAILKNESLDAISPLYAIDQYLQVAQENLVSACGQVAEASDALVLMGKIQKRMGGAVDTHSAAVALTYHRAAAIVDPNNAVAHRELGKSLENQGMIEQAAQSFARCVQLDSTHENFRLLMRAAQKIGDKETAQHCQAAIDDPRLAKPLPIQLLDPKSFANTYQPDSSEIGRTATNQTVSVRKPNQTPAAAAEKPKSKLSQWKAWLPKFRHE